MGACFLGSWLGRIHSERSLGGRIELAVEGRGACRGGLDRGELNGVLLPIEALVGVLGEQQTGRLVLFLGLLEAGGKPGGPAGEDLIG